MISVASPPPTPCQMFMRRGGKPIFALAILGMPIGKVPPAVVRRILKGGEAVCGEAGIPVAGGHSIDSPEPIYGLVVIGI